LVRCILNVDQLRSSRDSLVLKHVSIPKMFPEQTTKPALWLCLLLAIMIGSCWTGNPAQAQSASNFWYFGDKAGLRFDTNPPSATVDGAMSQSEGCSVASDPSGQLLFYTNGQQVWSANHLQMPNGAGLIGNSSSSQVVTAQWPGNPNRHYIIHTDYYQGQDGVYYSVVDMQLNGGFGDVVVGMKNLPLHPFSEEKMAITRHFNGDDYWVVVLDHTTDEFLSFPLTSAGFGAPVKSPAGMLTNFGLSNMKLSPNGQLLVYTNSVDHVQFGNESRMFFFNNVTGELQFLTDIALGEALFAYGIEFSSDNSKLYISYLNWHNPTHSLIAQYDLLIAAQLFSIELAKTEIAKQPGENYYYSLQLGPDGKIYCAIADYGYVGVIDQPNLPGPFCNFIRDGVFLDGRHSLRGLPYVNTSDLFPATLKAGFSWDGACSNEPILFFPQTQAPHADSIHFRWNFGDPASGENDSSRFSNAQHVYADSGSYTVTLEGSYYFGNTVYTNSHTEVITVQAAEVFDLSDTTLCPHEPVTYDLGYIAGAVRWSIPRKGTEMLFIEKPGLHWAESDNGCVFRDTFRIAYHPDLEPDLGADTTKCPADTLMLVAGPDAGATYRWHNGRVGDRYLVKDEATIWVEVSDGNCVFSDTLLLANHKPLVPELGNDTAFCPGENLLLSVEQNLYQSVLWSDLSETTALEVKEAGEYWVQTTDVCFQLGDTIEVAWEECPCAVYIPSAFTPNGNALNERFKPKSDCRFRDYEFRIFNRWGELVFHSNDPQAGWSGEVHGQLGPLGVYVYSLQYDGKHNDRIISGNETGRVVLIR